MNRATLEELLREEGQQGLKLEGGDRAVFGVQFLDGG